MLWCSFLFLTRTGRTWSVNQALCKSDATVDWKQKGNVGLSGHQTKYLLYTFPKLSEIKLEPHELEDDFSCQTIFNSMPNVALIIVAGQIAWLGDRFAYLNNHPAMSPLLKDCLACWPLKTRCQLAREPKRCFSNSSDYRNRKKIASEVGARAIEGLVVMSKIDYEEKYVWLYTVIKQKTKRGLPNLQGMGRDTRSSTKIIKQLVCASNFISVL